MKVLIATRFFSGLFGGTFLAVAGGTAGDIFSSQQIQLPMSVISTSMFVGPCVGPFIGGFINYSMDWRWTYRITAIWAGLLLVLVVFFMPETRGKPASRNHKEKEQNTDCWRTSLCSTGKLLLRPFQFLVQEPICLLLNIYSAILLGILYLFFVAFPMVLEDQYGMTLWQIGLCYLGIIGGMCLAGVADPLWTHTRARLIKSHGSKEPEFRLPPAILGAPLVSIGLFIFGWTADKSIHWICPILGSALFGTG